jgi:uncharacterized membrane protein YgdD (TMEM256/DUF423 family)
MNWLLLFGSISGGSEVLNGAYGALRSSGIANDRSLHVYVFIGFISLFSGSISIWVLGNPAWLLRLTLIDEVGFFLSWVMLAWVGWANRKTRIYH